MTVDELEVGYYIFVGTAVGSSGRIVNPVFEITSDNRFRLVSESALYDSVYYYDAVTVSLKANGHNVVGARDSVKNQIGWTGAVTTLGTGIELSQDDIAGKIYPIE